MRLYTERLQHIDILKGIGIILMIIGHMHLRNNLDKLIYAFHMPLFFIISGYLYSSPQIYNNSVYLFCKKKAFSLLKPYFIVGLFYSCIYGAFKLFTLNSLKSLLLGLKGVFISTTHNIPIESALWFLPALFWVNIMYVLLDNYVNKNNLKILLLIFITIIGCEWTKITHYLPWGLNSAMSVLGFFAIGFWFRIIGEDKYYKFEKKFKNIYIKVIGYFVLFCVFGQLIMLNDIINTRLGLFGVVPLTYLNACAYCFLIYLLSKQIVKINYLNVFLKTIGINSIIFMCTNHIALKISANIFKIIGFKTGSFVEMMLEFIIAMVLMIIFALVVKNTRLKIIFNL